MLSNRFDSISNPETNQFDRERLDQWR